jgi:hypothetical protein
MYQKIVDYKGRFLKVGDVVILANADDLDNDDVQHEKGFTYIFIGGLDDNIGCFIDCITKQRTDFFADRTLKIKITKKLN